MAEDDTPKGMDIVPTGGCYTLMIDDFPIATSICCCYMRKLAGEFDRVRSMPSCEGMHHLTKLGFCDTAAERIFSLLRHVQPVSRELH